MTAAVTIAVQAWGHSGLDLRDFPGAASGTIVLSAARLRDLGATGYQPIDEVISALAIALPFDLLTSLHVVMVGFVVLAAVGLGLAGLALCGREAGIAAGLLAACSAQLNWLGWCITYDAVACGLAGLGLGVALLGAARSGRWLLLVPMGCGLVGLGVVAKEVAHPALAWLFAVPILAAEVPRRGRDRAVASLGCLATVAGAAWAVQWALPTVAQPVGSPRHTGTLVPLDPEGVAQGLGWALEILSGEGWVNALVPLSVVALVGALLPWRSWAARIVLGALTVVALGIFSEVVTQGWLRLRYFAVPTEPLLVLAGAALGATGLLLGRLARPLAFLPAVLGGGLMLFDTVRYAHDWTAMRLDPVGVEAAKLPELPATAWTINDRRVGTHYSDTSMWGAVELRTLMAEQADHDGPVAVMRMRDGRERHGLAIAAVDAGRHGEVVSQDACCLGLSSRQCAEVVLEQADEAGALVVLPRPEPQDPRVDMADANLYRALVRALAERSGTVEGVHWLLWQGQGSGGPLPCGQVLPHRHDAPPGLPAGPKGPPLGPAASRPPG
ncbi:MAG: hypothetical protein H6742_18160 [Alphaproteobacteria bacterium]|nr:hypothetical protein [Alphaproteobacteria bacterium]